MKNFIIDRKLKGGWIDSRRFVRTTRTGTALNRAATVFPGETLRARLISGSLDWSQYKEIK